MRGGSGGVLRPGPGRKTKPGDGAMAPSPGLCALCATAAPGWNVREPMEGNERAQAAPLAIPTPARPGKPGIQLALSEVPAPAGFQAPEVAPGSLGSPAGSQLHIPGWSPNLLPSWTTYPVGY